MRAQIQGKKKLLRALLMAAGVGTVMAIVFGVPDDGSPAAAAGVAVPAGREPAMAVAQSKLRRLPGELPRRASIGPARRDIFAPLPPAARAEPLAPAANSSPPPPTVPSNPYRFAGTVRYGNDLKVFIENGERIHEAKTGDMLEGGYRVDGVAADEVLLFYLPGHMTLRIVATHETHPHPVAAAAAPMPGASPGSLRPGSALARAP